MTLCRTGVDIVEIARVEKLLRRKAGAAEKLFSPEEIAYCESSRAHRASRYAARFAAKEAVWKAVSAQGVALTISS